MAFKITSIRLGNERASASRGRMRDWTEREPVDLQKPQYLAPGDFLRISSGKPDNDLMVLITATRGDSSGNQIGREFLGAQPVSCRIGVVNEEGVLKRRRRIRKGYRSYPEGKLTRSRRICFADGSSLRAVHKEVLSQAITRTPSLPVEILSMEMAIGREASLDTQAREPEGVQVLVPF